MGFQKFRFVGDLIAIQQYKKSDFSDFVKWCRKQYVRKVSMFVQTFLI